MIKKITLSLFIFSSFLVHSQYMVNDFESGASLISSTNFNANIVANPSKTGLNTSNNCLEVGRTAAVEWWRFFKLDINPDLLISSTEKKFVSVMVNYAVEPDLGIRFNASSDTNNGTDNGIVRALNTYDDSSPNTWQEIVFELKSVGNPATSAHEFTSGTLFSFIFHPDMGFNNSGKGKVLLTPNVAYIDEVRILDYNPLATTTNNWVGASSDITSPSNWSLGLPTASTSLVIPSGVTQPVIPAASNLTLQNLDIKDGASLKIESGASLIVTGNSSGNLEYERTLPKDPGLTNAWATISSPVSNVDISTLQTDGVFAENGSNLGLATYNQTSQSWDYFSNVTGANTGITLTAGKGYIAKLNNALVGNTLPFVGTYTTGNVETDISIVGGNKFNYVGNPFTSYINLGTFFTDNAATDRLDEQTIWIWDENKNGVNMGGYVQKMAGVDAAFEIAPGQGFFVSSGTAASNKVVFNAANQSHQTDTFLKAPTTRTEISLIVSQDNLISKTQLYYIDGATTGFDNGFDGSMFTGIASDLAVYTELISNNNGRKIGVQSLPNSDLASMIVPFGIKAVAGKEISISATSLNLPETIKVILEDRQENTFTNLNEGDFKIILKEDLNGSGRFFVHTTSNVLSTDKNTLVDANVYQKNNETLKVTGLDNVNGSVFMYNVLGKEVLRKTFNSSISSEISLPRLAKGIYIVKLETEKGDLSKKIIIE
ncbi:T9SS type A sorting domain-containing protein [Polaribacter aestuariivivens]|uniref:T9SS type A sorting domain-containing protein n=1 Tax=Polaribacter aestuariivivens TaxID=2304626 RepID=A0A5S3NAH6_9FLAO|nr:T9SS type A sorting domain-containing protein [Polaribacter aestuariivivens]TMM30609.1 T9SS type A sorting domain-containing protein [Polaribacter aestuariivivens]